MIRDDADERGWRAVLVAQDHEGALLVRVDDLDVDAPDNVAPDYKTQASALLYGDPYDWNNLNQPDSIADYLRTIY